MASPLTTWSSTADGRLRSTGVDYAAARDGTGTITVLSTALWVGQHTTPYVYESFVSFDTSSIGSGNTVTVATLSFYLQTDSTDTDFTIEARIFDWGASLASADYVPGGSLSGYTKVASKSTTPVWSAVAYTDLTSESAFLTNVSLTGTTYLLLDSSLTVSNTAPSGFENLVLYPAEDNTGGGGTDRDPKLYVEYTSGGTDRTSLIAFGVA